MGGHFVAYPTKRSVYASALRVLSTVLCAAFCTGASQNPATLVLTRVNSGRWMFYYTLA